MANATDDYEIGEESRFSFGWLAGLIGRIIVCLILVAVIAAAIYATCLPAITYHQSHPEENHSTARP
jgi:hypothetical protein